MHELPITENIVKIASEQCRSADAQRVLRICLVVGDYSGYVGSSIRMYFDMIAEGTPCEGAELEITRVKPMLRCSGCGRLFERELLSFSCPDCGGEGFPTDIGREFYIDSIEVE